MTASLLVIALILIPVVILGVIAVAAFVYFVMYKGHFDKTPPEKYRD
jgi:hypothetical protein